MAALLAVLLAFGAACGDDDGDDEITDGVTAVSENGDDTPSGDATTEATSGADTTPSAGGGEGAQIDISADNSENFSTDELTAPAGTITITFENNEDGVVHNFALFDSEDSAENVIDSTDLLPGPSTDEITVELEPGTYYYNCQVHPQMEGTLTVE
jgi:plastocyanin